MPKKNIKNCCETNHFHQFLPFWIKCTAFLLFAISLQIQGSAQPLGNEWINYTKTYYKIPVGNFNAPNPVNTANNQADKADYNGLRRINKSTLDALGLGSTNAEDFQLWRNGSEVPVYITKTSGLLGPTDYIEFWGEANDGKPDLPLFRVPENQVNNRWSFYSDTASYFLTVNQGANNARIVDTVSDPIASTITPAEYFMHTIRVNYRQFRYMGFGMDISDKIVRSSSFDIGEGWGTILYRNGATLTVALNPTRLYQYELGPLATLKYSIAGDRGFNRYVNVSIVNGASDSLVDSQRFLRLSAATHTVPNIPYSRLSNNALQDNNIKFAYRDGPFDGDDRFYLLKTEFTYARRFNFSGAPAFLFSLPANNSAERFDVTATGITVGFTPYILDLSNNKRYNAVKKVSPADTYAFELAPSTTERKLVFISGNTQNTHYKTIESNTVQPVQFTDYSSAQNQADYIIISNKRLFNSNGTNYVEKYREYRASIEGGGYKARVFEIDSLTDQFSYGIRKNPLAIRNFIRYAQQHFSSPVKYVFLIGHGTTYNYYPGTNLSTPNLEALNLVPTWGHPASDNMLVAPASNAIATPEVPIGRLSVINGEEVSDYLDKVKEYEQLQSKPDSILWQKNVLHLIGGSDGNIVNLIQSYMDYYKQIIEDTLAGAKVKTYVRINDPNAAANEEAIQAQVSAGTGLVTYFGHSSSTSMDFNLNDPYELSNTGGKYPMFILNGCNASEFYTNAPERLAGNGKTLSEKFITAKERGAIAFMSSSHFGVLQYLEIFTQNWYKSAGIHEYGKGVGNILKTAIGNTYLNLSPADFYNRLTLEEFILHADPALKLFTQLKPDYEIDSSNISFSPAKVTMATDSVTINCTVMNHGKANTDSVWFEINRTLPGGDVITVYKNKLPPITFSTDVSVKIPIVGFSEKGVNVFRVVLDSANLVDESIEDNNSAVKTLVISDNDVYPQFPYNYAIINKWPQKFTATTVNPMAPSAAYRLQVDTTILFNSPFLYQQDITSAGNLIEFTPSIGVSNGTVYYWRVSPIINALATEWTNHYSFIYLLAIEGFNQSHFFQHQESKYTNELLEPVGRKFVFDSTKNNLYITNSVYPTSGTEDGHFSITVNGNQLIQSACVGRSIIFNVFDSASLIPWSNAVGNRFGSGPNCANGREYNFEFPYAPASNRKLMMDFLDSIPKGMFVTARLILDPDAGQPGFPTGKADSAYTAYWLNDTLLYGSGKSLYHSLYNQGFYGIGEMNSKKTFAFVFKKEDSSVFKPTYKFSSDIYDRLNMNVNLPMPDTVGKILSPWFGPAANWWEMHWRGKPLGPDNGATDSVTIRLYGLKNGVEEHIRDFSKTQQDAVISDINANEYPYLRLEMLNSDPEKVTPHQLDYWRLNYQAVPEGAISPNLYFDFTRDKNTMAFKDTLLAGIDSLKFGVAFKNISTARFNDSVAVQVVLTNAADESVNIPVSRLKPLNPNDTVQLYFEMPIDTLLGAYRLYVNFNPNMAQKEVSTSNNFMYYSFFVTRSAGIDSGICAGSSPGFVSNIDGNSYQWQVNNGNGSFSNLTNSALYSGVNTKTLQLTAPATSMYGYKFRCLVNGNIYSFVYTLKFANSWSGAISTAWEIAGNWSCGTVPDANTDVYVPGGLTRYPVVNFTQDARSVHVQNNASVTVSPGQQLNITGK